MTEPTPFKPHSRTVHVLIALVALLIGGYWIIANLKFGKFADNIADVTRVDVSHPADGEKNVLPNIWVSCGLNAGHAIDPATVSAKGIRLYRATDHEPVP